MKKQHTIKGQRLSYIDKGKGDVLLFGHSYLFDQNMWQPQIDALSKHYRCIVPDLWGHGESEASPCCMTSIYDNSEYMIELMDHLNIDHFSLVGLSVGGMWGATLAANHPSRINALVLMGTYLGDEPENSQGLYFGLLDQIDDEQSISKAMAQTITPFFFAPQSIEQGLPCVEAFNQRLQSFTKEQLPELTNIGRLIFSRANALQQLQKITAPVLILTGEEDLPRPVSESQTMLNYLKRGKLDIIPKAGHISALEQPDFINNKLKNFFARVL
ncbi:MAG: alpha/beta hydrolase [Cellvibrionales bacterium]|nr:alpha/beta hydrolase [Cellvibrionales bacterium]